MPGTTSPDRGLSLLQLEAGLQQQQQESSSKNTQDAEPVIIRSKTRLSLCRLKDQAAMLWRMAGERQHDKALLPERSWLRDSSRCQSPAPPGAQLCQGASFTRRVCGQEGKVRAAGCWQCKGQIANESPSVNTDALWRGLWQKCSSCYKKPFTSSGKKKSQHDRAAWADSTLCLCEARGRQSSCQ